MPKMLILAKIFPRTLLTKVFYVHSLIYIAIWRKDMVNLCKNNERVFSTFLLIRDMFGHLKPVKVNSVQEACAKRFAFTY